MDDQPEHTRKIRSILFANCGLIPAGIDFIPQAMIDDGKLDVVVMSPRSAFGWLAMYAKILLKHSGPIPVMNFYRSGKVLIMRGTDGHPAGRRPLRRGHLVTVQVSPGHWWCGLRKARGG